MAQPFTYSSEECSIIVGPFLLSGFVPGVFLTARYTSPHVSMEEGCNEEAIFVEGLGRAGIIDISLSGASDAHKRLSLLLATKEVFPVFVRDGSGNDLLAAAECRFGAIPPFEKAADTVGQRTWNILALDMLIAHVGSVVHST